MLFAIELFTFVSVASIIWWLRPYISLSITEKTNSRSEESNKSLKKFIPLLNIITKFTKKVHLFGYKNAIQKKIIATNLQDVVDADQFIALAIVSAFGFLTFTAIVTHFYKPVMLFGFIFGLIFPTLQLNAKLKKRHRSFQRDLPYFLDMLTLAVDGGMGPRAAIRKVPAYLKNGPLKSELELVIHDIENGESEEAALKKMARRTDLSEIKDFSAAYSRVTSRGGSIATTIRIQADQMRIRRLQIAEKEGKEASVKMILPIAFCIFPVAVIMLFGPMIVKLINEGFR